jgi:hypothetical protein
MSQQLLKQEMTVSQILRTHGKQFTQIRGQYSDGLNGRCAIGVIMSYYGWSGNSKYGFDEGRSSLATLVALRREGVSYWAVTEKNDSGTTFGEIADYLVLYLRTQLRTYL